MEWFVVSLSKNEVATGTIDKIRNALAAGDGAFAPNITVFVQAGPYEDGSVNVYLAGDPLYIAPIAERYGGRSTARPDLSTCDPIVWLRK